MTMTLIKIVLSAIQKYCKNKEIGNCESCPFCIDDGWAVDCMFCGPHVGEGVIPENWELDKVDFKGNIDG